MLEVSFPRPRQRMLQGSKHFAVAPLCLLYNFAVSLIIKIHNNNNKKNLRKLQQTTQQPSSPEYSVVNTQRHNGVDIVYLNVLK